MPTTRIPASFATSPVEAPQPLRLRAAVHITSTGGPTAVLAEVIDASAPATLTGVYALGSTIDEAKHRLATAVWVRLNRAGDRGASGGITIVHYRARIYSSGRLRAALGSLPEVAA